MPGTADEFETPLENRPMTLLGRALGIVFLVVFLLADLMNDTPPAGPPQAGDGRPAVSTPLDRPSVPSNLA